MNASPHTAQAAPQLLDIIDLKWLLAREGLHLHVEKLQRDPVYAQELLGLALQSSNHALCKAALRMQQRLGLADRPA